MLFSHRDLEIYLKNFSRHSQIVYKPKYGQNEKYGEKIRPTCPYFPTWCRLEHFFGRKIQLFKNLKKASETRRKTDI